MTWTKLRIVPAAAAVLLAAVACDNAGSTLTPALPGGGLLRLQVYLDRDGSLTRNDVDTTFAGVKVTLRPPNGGSVIKTLSPTPPTGAFTEGGIVVGNYSVTVDPTSFGDSLVVGDISPNLISIKVTDTAQVVIRLSYPSLSIRQARQQAVGKRVMVRGLVLAGVQSFRDTTSHVRDTSVAIRMTRVFVRSGGGNNPGDSVTVLGTVSSRDGQPTLDQAVVTVFATRPAPVPLPVTSLVASSAQGGALDASLVLVSNLVISESGAQAPDYRVVASDGSGPLTILFDGTIPITPTAFPVGRTISVRGVLVPDGTGKWQLKPRNGNDVTLF